MEDELVVLNKIHDNERIRGVYVAKTINDIIDTEKRIEDIKVKLKEMEDDFELQDGDVLIDCGNRKEFLQLILKDLNLKLKRNKKSKWLKTKIAEIEKEVQNLV